MTAVHSMASETMLAFTRIEEVNSRTFIHQTDDGNIFFRNGVLLWIRRNDKKTETELTGCSEFSIMSAQGEAIYYGSNWERKIYKADLTESGVIQCNFFRQMLEGENLHPGGMCSVVRDGKIHIHKISDTLENGQLHEQLHVHGECLKIQELQGLHGDIAIFRRIVREPIQPEVEYIGENAVSLMCFRGVKSRWGERSCLRSLREFYAPWGSPAVVKSEYVYMTNGKSLFVVDPIRRNLLPPLEFSGVSAFHLAGIQDGTLFGRGKSDKSGKYYLMTARLPPEYVEKTVVHYTEQEPSRFRAGISVFSSDFYKNFTIKSIIGEGGFGCVFKVLDKLDNWEYAVKRIAVRPVLMKEALWEARVMARLKHPGIVEYKVTWKEEPPEGWQHEADAALLKCTTSSKRTLGNFKSDSFFIYIKLQLCSHSLHDWLSVYREQSTRNLSKMKLWFKQMVAAVEYIHGKNLFHRDLKPSNILFDEDDVVKICDLGIATVRKEEEDNTQSDAHQTVIGTRTYMSPEQLNGRPYSSPTDVFSLGLILAEMCLAMSDAERKEIFNNYRAGQQCDRIENPITKEFVEWLTQVNPENRPTCRAMQNHLFIA